MPNRFCSPTWKWACPPSQKLRRTIEKLQKVQLFPYYQIIKRCQIDRDKLFIDL